MVNCKFIKLMSEKSGGKGEEKRLVEKKKNAQKPLELQSVSGGDSTLLVITKEEKAIVEVSRLSVVKP